MRLTNNIRDVICVRVMKHSFEEKINAAKELLQNQADVLYRSSFSNSEWEYIVKCPPGFLEMTNAVTLFVCGENLRINLASLSPLPASMRYGSVPMEFRASVEDQKKYRAIKVSYDALEKERATARSKLVTALRSFPTTEKLLELWPEIEPFIEDMLQKKSGLPAIPISSLNQILHL